MPLFFETLERIFSIRNPIKQKILIAKLCLVIPIYRIDIHKPTTSLMIWCVLLKQCVSQSFVLHPWFRVENVAIILVGIIVFHEFIINGLTPMQ